MCELHDQVFGTLRPAGTLQVIDVSSAEDRADISGQDEFGGPALFYSAQGDSRYIPPSTSLYIEKLQDNE